MADAHTVADNLHLDVPGAGQEALDIEIAIAERRLGLRGAAGEGWGQILGVFDRPHPAAAAAGHRLDHHRAVGLEERLGLLQRGRAVRSGQDRHAARPGQRPRTALVAEQLQGFGRRPDEGEAGGGAGPREAGVLGEEPIARVDRIGAGGRSGADDLADVEIGGGAGTLQRDRFIGLAGVQRGGVVLGEHRQRGDAHLSGGARDPHGDLAAIGDQELLQWSGPLQRSAPPHQTFIIPVFACRENRDDSKGVFRP